MIYESIVGHLSDCLMWGAFPNPQCTTASCRGQHTQILDNLSPKRDCRPKRAKREYEYNYQSTSACGSEHPVSSTLLLLQTLVRATLSRLSQRNSWEQLCIDCQQRGSTLTPNARVRTTSDEHYEHYVRFQGDAKKRTKRRNTCGRRTTYPQLAKLSRVSTAQTVGYTADALL